MQFKASEIEKYAYTATVEMCKVKNIKLPTKKPHPNTMFYKLAIRFGLLHVIIK